MADISIIIPIYNVENYLEECLLSVEKLSKLVESEVILIDDGSTDRSPDIAKVFCDRNNTFIYEHIENKGVSAARNLGLDIAQGKYIIFVDADDIIVPEVYKEMLDIAVSNDLPLVRCNYVRIQNGNISHSLWGTRAMSNVKKSITTLEENPNLVYDTPSWNKIIKKSIFDDNNIRYPEGVILNEDAPVMLRVFYYSKQCATYFKTGYLWRIRTENTKGSATQNTKKEDALLGKLETTKDCLDFCIKTNSCSNIYKKLMWKFLSTELTEFIFHLQLLDKTEAINRVSQINSFLSQYDLTGIIETLPIAIQRMLVALKEEDIEALTKIANFRLTNITTCPIVYKKNKEAEMIVPKTIFATDKTSAKKEFIDVIPSISMTKAENTDDRLLLHGYLFQSRVETSEENPQSIEAFLLNCRNNRKIELETKIEETQFLTQQKGTDIYRWDYSACEYNYDYGGFRIAIEPSLLLNEGVESGVYSLHIAYKNSICEGALAVRGTSADAKSVMKKWCIKKNGRQVTTWIDRSGIVFIKIEAEKNSKKKGKTVANLPLGRRYKLSLIKR